MKIIYTFILLIILPYYSFSQTITGPSPVKTGTKATYGFNNGQELSHPMWVVNKGDTVSSWVVGTVYYVEVFWKEVGSGSVALYNSYNLMAGRSIDVQLGYCVSPPTPNATLSVSNNICGPKIISRSGSPPSGVLWYWQTDMNGKSIENSSPSMSVTASDIYFLRAKSTVGEGDCWSGVIGKSVTANPIIPVPATPTVSTSISGSQILTKSGNPSSNDIKWYWQGFDENGTDTSPTAAANTFTANVPGTHTYYIRSESSEGCWSEAVGVSVAVEDYNFIRTSEILIPGVKTESDVVPLSVYEKAVNTTFFDGLGRPMQEVAWQASPEEFDIVRPIVYDQFGRQAKNYLSFTSSEKEGWYKPNEELINSETGLYMGEAADFYAPESHNKIADDLRPFAETIFEPSPLNRPSEQGAPGQQWQVIKDVNGVSTRAGKTVKMAYLTNIHGITGEEIIAWELDAIGLPVRMGAVTGYIETGGYYSSSQLYVSSTIDEHGKEVREYTNKLGQVILKKVQLKETSPDLNNHEDWVQTYYIYDDFGNLRFVFQPKLIWKIAENNILNPGPTDLDSLAFQYKYDERKRMVEKRVPGADWVYMIYDKRDRLVLTQDGNQRNPLTGAKSWTFTKYDVLNRPILTGTYENDAETQLAMQTAVNQFYAAADAPGNPDDWFEERGTAAEGYTNNSFPKDNIAEYLTVTYYDDYAFRDELPEFGSFFNYDPDQLDYKRIVQGRYDFPETANDRVKGQVTGTKIKVLGEDQWIKTVNYYDDRYRPIQSITENHFVKKDIVSTLYDFPGKVLTTLMLHNSNTETNLKTYKEFTYDHAGRLLETYQQIGIDPADKVLLAQNEYNELGELVKKNLHKQSDATFAQSVDYRYNIRGWLNRINNSNLSPDVDDTNADFFGMELFYNYGFDIPQFNGNISGARWKNVVDEQERAYGYTYDAMNRLTGADYIAGETGTWTLEADRFEVGNIQYDHNGNIINLDRNGLFRHTPGETAEYGITDQLGYKYKGNQLMAVNDAIETPEETKNDFKDKGAKGTLDNPEYEYDPNGNMTRDGNKGIDTIIYNYLNLPKRVDFGNGKYMEYTYDAAGTKLYQIVVDGTNPEKRTDYIAGMVYENDKLQFMQHEEGRVIPPGLVPGTQPTTEYEYQYHLKDHLGNVRLTFTTTPEIDTDGASVEPAHIEDEKAAFLNYDEVTKINYSLFDHTGETESQYSVRLSGGERETIGLAKSMAVMTGDTIRAEVFGKYLDPDQTNWSQLLQEFITAVAENTVAPGTVIEASIAKEGEAFPFGGLLNKSTADQQGPQAYLNYLVFDKDFVLVEDQSGYVPLTQAAKEDGSNIAHEELNKEIIVGQPGYVYIYLSNDNPEPMEVYFDDFHITHAHSAIVEADDYYPFGLRFNSYNRENSIANKYLYNGKELQDDLDLGWMDYGARMYMPDIGRWGVVDPKAEKYFPFGPYVYAANIPTIIIDPNGMELDYSRLKGREHRMERREIKKAFRQIKRSGETGKQLVKFLKSKESGRIELTANDSSYPGQFDANYNFFDEGFGGLPGFKKDEIGGILNVDVNFLKDFDLKVMDVLVEEAAHAAINSAQAIENGSNGNGSEVLGGNNEFSAKAIVGQIENESGHSIQDFSNDEVARKWGVQAFKNRSTEGFYQNMLLWQSQQVERYKNLPNTRNIPAFLKRLIKN